MPDPLAALPVVNLKRLTAQLDRLVRGRLWVRILLGLALGLVVGIALGPSVGLLPPSWARIVGEWVALPGRLFLALLQMIVVPLVFASVVRGLAASESLEQLRRLGLRVSAWFLATTTIAITIGLAVASWVRPGRFVDSQQLPAAVDSGATQGAVTAPSIAELPSQLITLLPSNPLNAMVETQMLQVVLFAVILGAALLTLPARQAMPLLDFLESLQSVCMTIVRWAMSLAPLAVFGLLAQLVMQTGSGVLVGMAVYVACVVGGLLALLVVYLTAVLVLGKRSPLAFLSAAREVLLLAFSTSSSAAVMPLTIRTAEEKLKVRSSVAQFVVPLGATINMDGTALYQGVATLFLAQAFGVDIGFFGLAAVVVTAVGASVGAPGTPGVGIVLLAMILESVGVPSAGIALVLGVDRVLDMLRTTLNVTGDLTACVVMDRFATRDADQQAARASPLEDGQNNTEGV
jgi:Na+/H+-dicarboxylate symporter